MSMTVNEIAAAGMSAMSGASPMAPPQEKMSNLYGKIDAGGAGSINQAQFQQAFQALDPPAVFKNAGVDAVWARLDPTGSGQVSQQNFISTMKSLMVELRQPAASGAAPGQTATDATQALNSSGGAGVNVVA